MTFNFAKTFLKAKYFAPEAYMGPRVLVHAHVTHTNLAPSVLEDAQPVHVVDAGVERATLLRQAIRVLERELLQVALR